MDCAVGAVLVALPWVVATIYLAWRRRVDVQVGPGTPEAEEGEAEDVLDMVRGLQRQQKLLLGRLNSIAPPRAGTGAGDGGPTAPAFDPPRLTRADVLKEARRRGL